MRCQLLFEVTAKPDPFVVRKMSMDLGVLYLGLFILLPECSVSAGTDFIDEGLLIRLFKEFASCGNEFST